MGYNRNSGQSFKQWLAAKKSGATDLKEPEELMEKPKAKKSGRKPKAKK